MDLLGGVAPTSWWCVSLEQAQRHGLVLPTPVPARLEKLEGDMNIVEAALPSVVLVATIALVGMLVRYLLRMGQRRLP